MKKIYTLLLLLFLFGVFVYGQTASLKGVVLNSISNEPVPFANVLVYGTTTGAVTDIDGQFVFYELKPGFTKVQVSSIGFETTISAEVMVTNAKTPFIQVLINETSTELSEIKVKASPFKKREEAPVSLRSIGVSEIEKNPGGNRDISKVIQSLPGVAGSVSFRNDLIVRGGGPSENKFYLDGVEIPTLNHFATQGASGGPIGIINVDFIREVDFYSAAFPANRGNAMSSVLDFKQVDGNKDKIKFRGTIGASDLALTLDGPLSSKTSMVLSVRRSYLQFLFAGLGLPFLPTYNDAQFKVKYRINKKNELTFLGIGAIDNFELNLDADETPEQRYILGYLPVNEQRNYTLGAVYKHYKDHSYQTVVLSRNYLNNTSYKYAGNVEEESLKTLDYNSDEIETKLRVENTIRSPKGWRINFGGGMQYAQYNNSTFQLRYLENGLSVVDYDTNLDLFKGSLFGQVTKGYFNELLTLSLGLRTDANSYSKEMNNLLKQLSPRLSLSYAFAPKWALNMSAGRFYQLPPYTTMGYGAQTGTLINKENKLSYIQSDQYVAGLEHRPNEKSKITLEGFYKEYNDYPFSVQDSVSLASKGSDYGVFGDEEVLSIGKGRSYGAEFYVRHTNIWKFNTILSYTFVRSETKAKTGEYLPTAWDNRHLLNLTATRSFKGNWDFGFKFRYAGGAPYTPNDVEKSSYVLAWEASPVAYPDYDQYNAERLGNFYQLDVRVDKSFYFKKWSLMVYFDVQNLTNAKTDTPDILTVATDDAGNKIITNPTAPIEQQQYQMTYIKTEGSGTVLPTLGVMFEF